MRIKDAMSTAVVSVGPNHTLRQAAELMSSRHVGAAVVIDPESAGHGILTERDILHCAAKGLDLDAETVVGHLTSDLVYGDPEWGLREAAHVMVRGGFRHLVVVGDEQVEGVLSVRDIVRVWSSGLADLSAATIGLSASPCFVDIATKLPPNAP
ncbi:MAG TPA: CBS domain-containing protein [Candidatus Stackebrandtia faecavium]|nr:CBS domain-containing protein [Candidatus Stackebrandtia faecavium]